MSNSASQIRRLAQDSDPNEFMVIAARRHMEWLEQARPEQLPPPAWEAGPKDIWLNLAGRGYGKTRVGAEDYFWVGASNPGWRLGIIAPTHGDVRDTIFEGESGLLNVIPTSLIPRGGYVRTLAELTLRNGTHYKGYSATEPDRLRGPQFHRLWFDELAAFEANYPGCAQECWNISEFALRLGANPKALVTTTPKPLDLIRFLVKDPKVQVTVGSTYDNEANLPKAFFERIVKHEGTKFGEQEIHAKILDMEDVGVIKRSWFRLWPADRRPPTILFLLVSMDTAFTEKTIEKKDKAHKFEPDPTVIHTYGVFMSEHGIPQLALIDVFEDWLGLPALFTKAKSLVQTKVLGRLPDVILIEEKGSGISLRQMLANERIVTHAYNPGRIDKLTRLHLVSHLIQKGRVWLFESEKHRGAPKTWYSGFLNQVCTFVGDGSIKHDDHVDTLTQALRFLADTGMLPIRPQSPAEKTEADAMEAQLLIPTGNPYAA